MRNLGIKKRPMIYTVLSLFFLIEPLVKMIHLRINTGLSFSKLFETILAWENPVEVASYFLLFPLAGLALLKIRKGSYFLLMLIQIFCMYRILSFTPYQWPYFTKAPILLLWIFSTVNFLAILVFMHPSVRKPFF